MEESESIKKCYQAALRLLTKRDYPVRKFLQKLQEKGYSPDVSTSVLQKLQDQNYFDEKRYLQARIRGLAHKNYGPNYIFLKLDEEQVSYEPHEVEQEMSEAGITHQQQLGSLLRKKLGAWPPEESIDWDPLFRQKMIRFLQGKGHTYQDIQEVLQQTV